MKPQKQLFLKDWMALHPYTKPTASDAYFIRLSNQLLKKIEEVAPNEFSAESKRLAALSVAAYFEDVISGLGLFQAFTKTHDEMKNNIVSFVDEKYGIVSVPHIALYIKDANDPCYNKEIAEKEGLSILMEFDLPQNIIKHLIDEKRLPDLSLNSLHGKEHGTKLIQDNLEFMFRFFQPQNFV